MSDDGVYMDETRLKPFPDRPPPQHSNTTLRFMVNMTGESTWVLHSSPHQGFRQQLPPLMWNDGSRGDTSWGTANSPEGRMKNGSVVDIIFENAQGVLSMHPFHKHNHKAFIIGQGYGGFPFDTVAEALQSDEYRKYFNLVDPPIRDGCRLEKGNGAWTIIRYEISFPAVSMLHCHMIHHFAVSFQSLQLLQKPRHINTDDDTEWTAGHSSRGCRGNWRDPGKCQRPGAFRFHTPCAVWSSRLRLVADQLGRFRKR